MLKRILIGSSICTGLLISGMTAQAQTPAPSTPESNPQPAAPEAPPAAAEPSAEEVQQFANAIKQIQSIQQEAQRQADQVFESEGITPERFGEILQSQQNPQAQPQPEVTPEEQQNFDQVLSQLTEIQQTTQTRVNAAIQEEGLDSTRFNQIMTLVRQDPELRQRVQQELQN
ncbi:MAG: DUF4168 domain-containing protein [Synechococcales cyanobacterium M58_A2018_015]|nr:DUF4168 domain-containing protein [Synechococcales cyanobacterium M58_A2018_015]